MTRRFSLPAWLAASAVAFATFAPAGTASATVIAYSGSIVQYTITQSGLYSLTAIGATGGAFRSTTGGAGAMVSGELSLSAETILYLVVGGVGTSGVATSNGSGGGGGSFIYFDAAHPLLVAGGGGGAGFAAQTGGGDGRASTSGGNGGDPSTSGHGGIDGAGGQGGQSGNLGFDAGGGTGFFSDGGAGASSSNGAGGNHTTFAGGAGVHGENGGFGGGGGGTGEGGGGGGGYSGGGGGSGNNGRASSGGGGGSFASGDFLETTFTSGFNALGNGSIDITLIAAAVTPTAVPEPASMALLFTGLALLVHSRRRRSSTRPAVDRALCCSRPSHSDC